MIITDKQAQEAFHYLHDEAAKAGKARAQRIYMEEYRKTVKANEMQKHVKESVGAQEREAYASENYKQHLLAMRDAIETDETHRWRLVGAQATLDAWRTQNANKRAESKIG
jgi:tRNA A37 N6-isopentenylltransferase MiaA